MGAEKQSDPPLQPDPKMSTHQIIFGRVSELSKKFSVVFPIFILTISSSEIKGLYINSLDNTIIINLRLNKNYYISFFPNV